MKKDSGKRLLAARAALRKEIFEITSDILSGVFPLYRQCGKPGCKCQKEGYKHGPAWCIHYREKGKLKMVYVPEQHADVAKTNSQKYKRFKQIAKQICRINLELLKIRIKSNKL